MYAQLAVTAGRPRDGRPCGEAGMRAVFEEAGYTTFRRATETPFNIVYEAAPNPPVSVAVGGGGVAIRRRKWPFC